MVASVRSGKRRSSERLMDVPPRDGWTPREARRSATADPRRGDLPPGLLERAVHGRTPRLASGSADREHVDGLGAVAQVEGVVALPGGGDTFVKIDHRTADRD